MLGDRRVLALTAFFQIHSSGLNLEKGQTKVVTDFIIYFVADTNFDVVKIACRKPYLWRYLRPSFHERCS